MNDIKPTVTLPKVSPIQVLASFFRLGLVAFGGPAAHIALMESEFVEKKKWLGAQAYLDLIGAANLIPGPNSTETAMHVGYKVDGYRGLLLAGFGFIFPAASLTLIVAWLYMEGRDLEAVRPVLIGIQAGVLAIIAMAVWKLGKKAAKTNLMLGFGVAAALAVFLGAPEVVVILCGGAASMLYQLMRRITAPVLLLPVLMSNVVGSTTLREQPDLLQLFLVFLKTGAVLFGSGYVLVAYLEADLVERGWLTQAELLDAIAMGQFTPGPVLTTATFVGYQLSGFQGALLCTLGIFLPSFLFVALTAPWVDRLRKSSITGPFLDGASAAAVGVMAAVLVTLCGGLAGNWWAILIALGALVLLIRKPAFSAPLLVVISGLLGLFFSLL